METKAELIVIDVFLKEAQTVIRSLFLKGEVVVLYFGLRGSVLFSPLERLVLYKQRRIFRPFILIVKALVLPMQRVCNTPSIPPSRDVRSSGTPRVSLRLDEIFMSVDVRFRRRRFFTADRNTIQPKKKKKNMYHPDDYSVCLEKFLRQVLNIV